MERVAFGRTSLSVPPIVFGTASLGNMYRVIPEQEKFAVIEQWFQHVGNPVFVDTAGKYGAGLSLEVIGRALRKLNVRQDDVIISNKLAWTRQPLLTPEPTFEPGAWKGLEYDAKQEISHDGILRCYEDGNALLGYQAQLVSVHDPDEYLFAAQGESDLKQRKADIDGAYSALAQLRADGKVKGVGIGVKDWKTARDVVERNSLDWAMLANCLTIMSHPPELLEFAEQLDRDNIPIVDAALFNGGFTLGGDFFDYRLVGDSPEDRELLRWRDQFHDVCNTFDVPPAHVCIQFGRSIPAVKSIAVGTANPANVGRNIACFTSTIPDRLWTTLKDQRLIRREFPYLG